MTHITEKIVGVVQRVTYHNPDNGWSVLKVQSFQNPGEQVAVTVHQMQVFAGATMEFQGAWVHHRQFGRQFKATHALEKKPASVAALEKYLGSGLIKGVGPKTARKIVKHFGEKTLHVFEDEIDRLTEIEGIAEKKLQAITEAWREHRMIREVMIFLQGHGISTLFAVRIYKKYGDNAIGMVTEDPYRLAVDFYGIGFFSADRVALSLGIAPDSDRRLIAAVRHVLSASREQGHCYLRSDQIRQQVEELLDLELGARIETILKLMEEQDQLRVRWLMDRESLIEVACYYSKTLYYDELSVARKIRQTAIGIPAEEARTEAWIERYCAAHGISLSGEQKTAVARIVHLPFSVLTGGPGCGKTTTTLVIVRLLEAMGKKVLLAAPTGRASQRMSEVIGRDAMTLHRLLVWQQGQFCHNEENPLDGDFLIVDECSMLDISLSASLLRAVPERCGVLFIGDADQLPSVGAGNVLRDIIASAVVPCFRLTKVFRQARQSAIIGYAHDINKGEIPDVRSPFKCPEIWQKKEDCIFLDSEEATQEQMNFIGRVKRGMYLENDQLESLDDASPYRFGTAEAIVSPYEKALEIPKKFAHVNIEEVLKAKDGIEELKAVLRKVHPWSTLHYGLSAVQTVVNLYMEWIPKYYGKGKEIQILSPMTRGSLGTLNLNSVIQNSVNPPGQGKPQVSVGERVFRVGDRVIHRRNNYDLQVFNGDIGRIVSLDTEALSMVVSFFPDEREVIYQRDDIVELDLAYAITIHKSQGSEFPAVILPVLTQHFKMLYRNLIYTGLTRARELAVFVGSRKALAMAVKSLDSLQRQTALAELLVNDKENLL